MHTYPQRYLFYFLCCFANTALAEDNLNGWKEYGSGYVKETGPTICFLVTDGNPEYLTVNIQPNDMNGDATQFKFRKYQSIYHLWEGKFASVIQSTCGSLPTGVTITTRRHPQSNQFTRVLSKSPAQQ